MFIVIVVSGFFIVIVIIIIMLIIIITSSSSSSSSSSSLSLSFLLHRHRRIINIIIIVFFIFTIIVNSSLSISQVSAPYISILPYFSKLNVFEFCLYDSGNMYINMTYFSYLTLIILEKPLKLKHYQVRIDNLDSIKYVIRLKLVSKHDVVAVWAKSSSPWLRIKVAKYPYSER